MGVAPFVLASDSRRPEDAHGTPSPRAAESAVCVAVAGPRLLQQAVAALLARLPGVHGSALRPELLVIVAGLGAGELSEVMARWDPGPARSLFLAGPDPAELAAACRLSVQVFAGLDEPLAELQAGLRAARDGRPYCSPQLLPRLMEAVRSAPNPVPALPPAARLLTPRELEVARYVAEGLCNKEIAELMCLSVPGVKFHLKQVYRKLQVERRAQVIPLVRL